MNNLFDLTGKVALVTGGSTGIGFSIGVGLAKAGAKIVFNNMNEEFVQAGIQNYAEQGIKAEGFVCDVTDEAMVQKMVEQIGTV